MIVFFRRLLIRIGKSLPFILCGLVMLSCIEMSVAITTTDFVSYEDVVILNTPISFAIAKVFEYDLLIVFITLIVSIAIEACKWNLFATFFLLVHLLEKSYFDFELEPYQIYVIIAVNLLASGFFVYNGIRIITNKRS